MKGNVIRLNIMHLNSVHLNSIGEVQSVSLKAGESTEDPVYPPTTYTLAANVSNGKVTATKNGTAISLPYVATEGDVIVLSVTPDEGYEFKGWLDGNKSNPRTVTMTGNVVLSASCVEIAKPTYTLSASVTNGMVSAKRNGSAVNLPFTANEGDTIVVEVTPNDGYAFEGWADGNTDNPRSITMTADVALSAQCVEVVVPPAKDYIQFEDKAVEAICVANWSSDGIGLTEEDAAKVTSIGTVFKGNTEITTFNELRYFTKVTSIPTNAFDACSNLRSIGVNWDEVTSIGANAFRNCSSLQLEEVAAPNLTNLGSAAFHAIPALKRVSNLGSIPSVALQTFYKTGLLFIDLPATITEIGSQAFRYVTTLEQVIVRATTPPSLNSLAFQNTNDTFLIYVPDASLEAYRTATNWNTYADRIHPLSEIEGVGADMVEYDRLIGDGVAYIEMPIKVKEGYSYTFNVFVDEGIITNSTTGVLCSNGIKVVQNTFKEVFVQVAGGSKYSKITGLNQLSFTPQGVFKNGSSIAQIVVGDAEDNLTLFADKATTQARMGRQVQIRSIEIANAEGVLIHNFKPYTIGAAIGLYDIIGGLMAFNSAGNGQLSVENDE